MSKTNGKGGVGRLRPANDGRVYVSLRLDPRLVERIDAETEVRIISRTRLIERALEDWLSTHEGQG